MVPSFFRKRKHKRHPSMQMIVTPTQVLVASAVVLVVTVCPLLTVQFGRPTSWFGNFLFLLCATFSLFAPLSLCVATFIDLIRRKGDARLIAALVLSLAGVAAIATFIYFCIHPNDSAA